MCLYESGVNDQGREHLSAVAMQQYLLSIVR